MKLHNSSYLLTCISEDDIDIVYFHNLTSLRASYRRLHDMTNVELEQKLDENLSYLERVIQGLVPNERHEVGLLSIVTVYLSVFESFPLGIVKAGLQISLIHTH